MGRKNTVNYRFAIARTIQLMLPTLSGTKLEMRCHEKTQTRDKFIA